ELLGQLVGTLEVEGDRLELEADPDRWLRYERRGRTVQVTVADGPDVPVRETAVGPDRVAAAVDCGWDWARCHRGWSDMFTGGGAVAGPAAARPRSDGDVVAQRGDHPVDGLLRLDALLALVGHEDEHDGGRRPLRGAGGHRDRVEADYRWRARVPWRPDPAAQREVPGRGSRDADLLRPGGRDVGAVLGEPSVDGVGHRPRGRLDLVAGVPGQDPADPRQCAEGEAAERAVPRVGDRVGGGEEPRAPVGAAIGSLGAVWPAGAGGRRVRLFEPVADLPVRRDRVDQPGGAVDVLPVRRWRALREGGARLLARRFGRPFSPVHVVPDEAARARRDGERGQQCERGRGPDRGTPAHRLSPVRRGP